MESSIDLTLSAHPAAIPPLPAVPAPMPLMKEHTAQKIPVKRKSMRIFQRPPRRERRAAVRIVNVTMNKQVKMAYSPPGERYRAMICATNMLPAATPAAKVNDKAAMFPVLSMNSRF